MLLNNWLSMCYAAAGQQIAQSAASDGAAASAAVNEEEVRGPHASLAVRLQVMHPLSEHSSHVIARSFASAQAL